MSVNNCGIYEIDMSEIILVLWLIIVFGVITDIIIIFKQRSVKTLEMMGIDIEKRCPELKVNMTNENDFFMKDMTGVVLFVEEDCITCQTVINSIETSGLKNDRLYTVLIGEKENAVNFMENHSSWKRVGFLDRNVVSEKLNISAFPYFMLLQDGVVKEKGFPQIEKIMKVEI